MGRMSEMPCPDVQFDGHMLVMQGWSDTKEHCSGSAIGMKILIDKWEYVSYQTYYLKIVWTRLIKSYQTYYLKIVWTCLIKSHQTSYLLN